MSAVAKRSLALVGFAAICFAFLQNGANIVSPLMATILADFPSEEPTSVILIQTLPSLGMVLGSLLYGMLTRSMSNRVILTLASCVYAAASVTPVFLGHMLMPLLAVRVSMGVSCGLFAAMGVALVAASFDEKRSASYMGYLVSAQSVALLVFQTGAGVLGASNWRIALLIGLLCVPVCIYGLATLPKEDRVGRQRAYEMRVARKRKIRSIPFLQRYPLLFFAWCLEGFLFMAGIFVLFVNTSIMIESSGFGGAWDAVLVLNVHTGAGLIFSLLFGKMYAKVKDYLLFISAFAAVLSFLCFVFAQNILWMSAGAFLLGFAVPSFIATLYQLVGKRLDPLVSATATSILVAVQQMGALLMVYFVKPLCDVFGLDFSGGRDPFFAYSIIFLVIAGAVLIQALYTRHQKT